MSRLFFVKFREKLNLDLSRFLEPKHQSRLNEMIRFDTIWYNIDSIHRNPALFWS